MNKRITRALIGFGGAVALLVSAATPATAATTGGGPKLTDLAFAQASIDATTGTAVNVLSWSVTDKDTGLTDVHGTLDIRQAGSQPGTFVGRTFEVTFGTAQDGSVQVPNISGDLTKSIYAYGFPVPRYAMTDQATWVVTGVTVTDNTGQTRSYTANKLASYASTFTATEVADPTAPTLLFINLAPGEPDAVYLGTAAVTVDYQFFVQDVGSGVDSGRLIVTGPSLTTSVRTVPFQVVQQGSGYLCGPFLSGSPTSVECQASLTFPASTPAGDYTVSAIDLTDAVGNTSHLALSGPTVSVTRDSVIQASGFAFQPAEVDNWSFGGGRSQLTMTTTGPAVTSVVTQGGCLEGPTTPTDNGDGTISVAETLQWMAESCDITGIKLIDAAGDVSVYGSFYGAPALDLTLHRTPDTTPPIATAAHLSVTTITASHTPANLFIVATVQSQIPIDQFATTVYDSGGQQVGGSGGGLAFVTSGTVQLITSVGALVPGTYTVAFSIVDEGNLFTRYGYPDQPAPPWGALQFTVTSG